MQPEHYFTNFRTCRLHSFLRCTKTALRIEICHWKIGRYGYVDKSGKFLTEATTLGVVDSLLLLFVH